MPQGNPTVQSVSDVYDLASAIGKEFESLIDQFGAESLSGLMPKVISALENLEHLTCQAEAAAEELADLKRRIDRMEVERAARLTDRGRFELEMEQADQEWRLELEHLREQNRILQQALDDVKRQRSDSICSSGGQSSLVSAVSSPQQQRQQQQQQLLMIARLKAALNAQRDEARSLRRELANSKADCEALQAQSDRLATLNAELMKRIGKTDKAGWNIGQISPRSELGSQDDDTECEVERRAYSPMTPRPRSEPASAEASASQLDPNRPRFTLAELRVVLAERNELKARLIEMEEELACRRPANGAMSSFEEDPSNSINQFPAAVSSPLPAMAHSNYDNNASSAQLLISGSNLPEPASPTMSLRRGASNFDGGVENGAGSASAKKDRSNSSDLGIKYFIFRLICHLRKRLKRRRSWS